MRQSEQLCRTLLLTGEKQIFLQMQVGQRLLVSRTRNRRKNTKQVQWEETSCKRAEGKLSE